MNGNFLDLLVCDNETDENHSCCCCMCVTRPGGMNLAGATSDLSPAQKHENLFDGSD